MGGLFIGLGGVGTKALDFLYQKIDIYNKDLAMQGKPQVDAYYYYVDTDNSRLMQAPQEFMGGSNRTFHQIGLHSPESIINALRNSFSDGYELLQKWYDAPAINLGLTMSADTIRQYSRLAFAYESSRIRWELETLIRQVYEQQGRIYVITGSCGGTGSGIYMDLLYMISEIYAEQIQNYFVPDVRLIIAMPEGYVDGGRIDPQHVKLKLNAYATLEELNAICKDKDSAPSLFNGCYIGGRKKEGQFQPFRFCYLFDSARQTRDEVCLKLSDLLFELELVAGNQEDTFGHYYGSSLDISLNNSVEAHWNNSICNDNDYVKAFNAVGHYSIEKPDFLFRKYLHDRLLFETFHKGMIGNSYLIDTDSIFQLATKLKEECDDEITQTCNIIKANIISKVDFENEGKADITFSVFSKAPNKQEETVKNILEKKDVLLQTIKNKVYHQCKEWLGQYDFTTVFAIFDRLDIETYADAVTTNRSFEEQKQKAREASLGGILWKKVHPEKALKEFDTLLHSWLAFEVNKALSSGINVDITEQNRGYLDDCKSFIVTAKHNLSLKREQECWERNFIREVAELKAQDNRCFIPDLNTIVDGQYRIIPDSPIVNIYEESYVRVHNEDVMNGICPHAILHKKIIGEMRENPSLKQEGLDMDEIFDPMPGNPDSLRNPSKAELFMEKYVETANGLINLLLKENRYFQSLCGDDILKRLQNLPTSQRAKICMNFAQYDKVQLNTEDMLANAVDSYTYYIISDTLNEHLMKDLGILDASGQKCFNSDYTPNNPFFRDKIIKLIVKTGYKIDDYRYFVEYKGYVEEAMREGVTYDPFIDKRFLGEPNADGKYSCDVSMALQKIVEDDNAAQIARQFSLDGFNEVEIYIFCLSLLYEYFDALKQYGVIDPDLLDAISHSDGTKTISIQQVIYDTLLKRYILHAPRIVTIDLAKLSSLDNMEDLTTWINFVLSKKEFIHNETELYGKALDDFNLHFAKELESILGEMIGEGNKPVYDFFAAYLEWYNKRIK